MIMHKMSMNPRENSQKNRDIGNDAPVGISVCEIHFAPAKSRESGRHVARPLGHFTHHMENACQHPRTPNSLRIAGSPAEADFTTQVRSALRSDACGGRDESSIVLPPSRSTPGAGLARLHSINGQMIYNSPMLDRRQFLRTSASAAAAFVNSCMGG